MKIQLDKYQHELVFVIFLFTSQFCFKGMNGAKFVFEAVGSDGDLLSANAIRGLCDLEEQYLRPYFKLHCPLISIARVVTDMVKKPCSQITDNDTEPIRNLFGKCAPFYYNSTLKDRVRPSDMKAHNIPPECIQRKSYNFVYSTFYYLANVGYMSTENPSQTNLRYTIAYMVFAESIETDWENFYRAYLENEQVSNSYVRLAAVDLPDQEAIKYDLFSEYIYSDMKLFVLAALLIVAIMIAYLKSVALMVAAVLNVVSSFVLAYFLYSVVFRITFFPFLNVLALLVLIAVGADDVFIFCDTWEQVHRGAGTELPLDVAMARTFSHAALSIFVTSLTTAAAFFANVVSQITVIRCFGIFAGLSMLCNFFFMIVWTPSILIISVKVWDAVLRCCNSGSDQCFRAHRWLTGLFAKLNHRLFSCIFPYLIEKIWPVWLVVFIGFGFSSCFIIFVNPKLRLPTSQNFQLLDSNNILEKWDSTFQDRFQSVIDNRKDSSEGNVSLIFVWGFEPNYGGFSLNPEHTDRRIMTDSSFDFYSTESQVWSQKFCELLKSAPFVNTYAKTMPCMMDQVVELVKDYCVPPYSTLMPICCTRKTPPFTREQLEVCGPLMMYDSTCPSRRNNHMLYGKIGQMVYDGNNRIKGFVVSVDTNMRFSLSYSTMDSNYKQTEAFLKGALATAPAQMNKAFFAVQPSFFALFYDLQRGIALGTFYSIGISLGIAFLVMFLATRNVLVTIYAVVNIGCVILCTIALIVLLGWDLNILESITVSLGIGLSIDFTIHYGVAYSLSEHSDSKSRTRDAFARVGGAVAMSALTTFVAGTAMLPSHVLAYYKLGTFLMIIMAFSWAYSTFLFQSLCRIVGPRGNFCQVSLCGKLTRPTDVVLGVNPAVASNEDGPPVFTSTYVNFVTDQATVSTNDQHSFSSVAV